MDVQDEEDRFLSHRQDGNNILNDSKVIIFSDQLRAFIDNINS